MAEINVVPHIDVIALVLLVIFMITCTHADAGR